LIDINTINCRKGAYVMSMDTIKNALEDALGEDPNSFAEKINSVLASKLQDALQTKKIEVSNNWLNDIEPPVGDEEEEDEP